jgi:hypothetical protein
MPDLAQVEIGGQRYHVRRDTIYTRRAPGTSTPLYTMADVVRVPS